MESYDRSRVRHLDFRLGCYSAPPGIRTSGPCTLRVPERRGRLVLIGDSNAGQFTEPVVRAGNRAGFDVTIKVISSCPFVDLSVVYAERQPGFSDPRQEMASCRRFYVRTLDALVRLRPNVVVTSARADAYIGRAVIGLGSPNGDITHLAQAKGQLYSQGLASTLRRLNDAGVPVVIVHPVPVVQSNSVYECAVIRILTESCVRSVARSAVDQSLQPSVDAGNRAVRTAPAAWALDFRNRLCNRDRCTGKHGNTLLYRDKNHLSVDGALELTNEFYRAILAHARP
jgi:hypothetical protein